MNSLREGILKGECLSENFVKYSYPLKTRHKEISRRFCAEARMSKKYNEKLAINTDCPKFFEDKKRGLYDLYSVETERESLIESSLLKNPFINPSFSIFLFKTFNFDVLQSHLFQK